MFDFDDVQAATVAQEIRAYSVERALELFSGNQQSADELVCVSKMIEDYITNGDTSNVISSAVEEGVREGRLEVLNTVAQLSDSGESDMYGDLHNVFVENDWLKSEKGND